MLQLKKFFGAKQCWCGKKICAKKLSKNILFPKKFCVKKTYFDGVRPRNDRIFVSKVNTPNLSLLLRIEPFKKLLCHVGGGGGV